MVYLGHLAHYWHKNITSGESCWDNPKENCRNFATTQEMSQHIVKQINKYVKEDDILFHLGDWSFSGIENVWNFRKQIRCKNIHLILGNHDAHIKNNKTLKNCTVVDAPAGDIVNFIFIDRTEENIALIVKAQDIFSSVSEYLEIIIDGIGICMMHYPIEEWNDNHGKEFSYMLHGHQHGKNTIIPKRLDVGIDNAHKLLKEYRPFSWEDIKAILK